MALLVFKSALFPFFAHFWSRLRFAQWIRFVSPAASIIPFGRKLYTFSHAQRTHSHICRVLCALAKSYVFHVKRPKDWPKTCKMSPFMHYHVLLLCILIIGVFCTNQSLFVVNGKIFMINRLSDKRITGRCRTARGKKIPGRAKCRDVREKSQQIVCVTK